MKSYIEIESYHAFQVPKADGDSTYCEDAYFPEANENTIQKSNNGCYYIAVADGVSETSYAKEWAEQLTKHFNKFDPEAVFANWVKEQQAQFEKILDSILLEEKIAAGGTLPWFLHDKVADGAAATFVGLILNLADNTFHCFAVGDAVVIMTKPNQAPFAWPIDKPDKFNDTPSQINSKHTKAEYIDKIDHRLSKKDNTLTGDETFLLMTDALAAWTLQDPVKNITELLNLSTNEAFAAWVKNHRHTKVLKNDDTTLCIIRLKNVNSTQTNNNKALASTEDTLSKLTSNKDKESDASKAEDTLSKLTSNKDKESDASKAEDTRLKSNNDSTNIYQKKVNFIDKYKYFIYKYKHPIIIIQFVVIIILIIFNSTN